MIASTIPHSRPLQCFHSPIGGRTVTIEAQIDPATGSDVVLWRHIQCSFPGIRHLRHGNHDIYCVVDPATLKECVYLYMKKYPEMTYDKQCLFIDNHINLHTPVSSLEPPRVQYCPNVVLQVVTDETLGDDPCIGPVVESHCDVKYLTPIPIRFAEIVALNNGNFTEDFGRVEITLSTPPTALTFYGALKKTKGMQELTVRFVWDPTKLDIQQFCDTILESDVSILTVDGSHFDNPTVDVFNRSSRFDPFIQLLETGKLQAFTIKDCPRFLDRISSAVPQSVSTLRALHLDCNDIEKESKAMKQKTVSLLQRFPNLTEATLGCSDLDEMFTYLHEHLDGLPKLAVLKLIQCRTSQEATVMLSDGMVVHVDLVVQDLPKMAFSRNLRQLDMRSAIIPLPDVKRLVYTNEGLTKLVLKMPKDYFNDIFLFDTLMPGRPEPLLVAFAETRSKPLLQVEFWNATKEPSVGSVGKWIQWTHSMIQVQVWGLTRYNFHHLDKDAALFLSGLGEMARDAEEVVLDLNASLLTDVGIRAVHKAMTFLRPRHCHIVLKESDQKWANCFDVDPLCWSKLRVLEVTGGGNESWVHCSGQSDSRESMPLLENLILRRLSQYTSNSNDITSWLYTTLTTKGTCEPLKSLSIIDVYFTHDDWRKILGSVDYSTLETLRPSVNEFKEVFPGSRERATYTAADLCRYVGLGIGQQEKATNFVLVSELNEVLEFIRRP